MKSLFRWLLRSRDQNTVTYSRFGLPGEQQDERPPPTNIIIAPFDDNLPAFRYFNMCHSQKAAMISASIGLSITLLIFISSFFEFDWYHHDRGVDFLALLGLILFLIFGIMVHYYVIYGIKRQVGYFLLPFMVVYTTLIAAEFIGALSLIYHMIYYNGRPPAYDHSTGSSIGGEPESMTFVLISLIIVIVIELMMLNAVARCRQYLSCKEMHTVALNVAEKSRLKYPQIQIIIGSSSSTTTTNAASSDNRVNATTTSNGTVVSTVSSVQAPSIVDNLTPPQSTVHDHV